MLKDHLEDLSIVGRTLLQWSLKKWNGRTFLVKERGKKAGTCYHGNEHLGFIIFQ